MAPSRPVPCLVVRTPRHASRRLRPALVAEIRRQQKERNGPRIDLDPKLTVIDPTRPLGIASDNASEWNSMLITARAERGPQWDVSTQRFMVDYGSHLYFDPAPLTIPEERTPPPEEPAAHPPPSDPSALWQDPRYAQYTAGNPNLGNIPTPARTSLRLQQQQQQQQHQHQHQHQQHQHQTMHHALNGHHNVNQYPYALTNGRPQPTPQQQQQQQQHPQPQLQPQPQPQHFEHSHSYYDSSQNQHQAHHHGHHGAMTNGLAIGSPGGSPMMARQPSMGGSVSMGMEYPMGGGMPEQDMRRRTRSQQDIGVNMEMGGW